MNPGPSTHPRSARSRFPSAAAQLLLPASLAAFVVARCAILSGKRLLNTDEFLTWYPVCAPFRAMLSSTADTINASPPLYLGAAWFWASLFGRSALSLRLLSALAAAGAIFAAYAVLRRAYGVLAAGAALALMLLDPELLFQSGDARFYALLLAEAALGILLYQRLMETRRPSLGLLAANAAVHACLVMTHYFGLVYSGVILGGVLLTCVLRRRNPLPCALSIVAGWLAFLPWIPVFRRHVRMGRPSFWVTAPSAADLRGYFAHFITADFRLLAAILCGCAAVAVLLGAGRRRGGGFLRGIVAVRRLETPLLALVPLFALVPLAIFFASTLPGATSTFLERYLTLCALGWAILCAHVASRVFGLAALVMRPRAARVLLAAQVVAVALFVGRCGWEMLGAARLEHAQGLPASLPPAVPLSEPVVVESIHDFLRLHFYSAEPRRYLFVVDREAANNLGGGYPANHLIMETLKRDFPEQFEEVVPSGPFLAGSGGFWVMLHDSRWWKARLAADPDFVSDVMIPRLGLVHERRRK